MTQLNSLATGSRRAMARIALLAALGVSALLVTGMMTDARGQSRSQDSGEAGITMSIEPRISLSFDGGTALSYLDAIRTKSKDANIIVKSNVELVLVPKIQLQDVTVRSAIMLLDDFDEEIGDGDQVRIDVNIITDPEETRLGQDGRVVAQPAPIYVVNARTMSRRSDEATIVGSMVWTVQEILNSAFTSDGVIAAIETAIPLSSVTEPAVEIRFHEETGILIARGPHATLGLIDNVLNELQRSAHIRMNQERQARMESDQMNEMRMQLERMAVQEAKSVAVMDELEVMRMRLAEMETQRAIYQEEMHRQQDSNARLQEQIQALELALARERGGDPGDGE